MMLHLNMKKCHAGAKIRGFVFKAILWELKDPERHSATIQSLNGFESSHQHVPSANHP